MPCLNRRTETLPLRRGNRQMEPGREKPPYIKIWRQLSLNLAEMIADHHRFGGAMPKIGAH